MMETKGRVLQVGFGALAALLVLSVPGCGGKAAEKRYQHLNGLRTNLYDVALLIHNFQAESGRVFTDFSKDGYGGMFAGGGEFGTLPIFLSDVKARHDKTVGLVETMQTTADGLQPTAYGPAADSLRPGR
jgi:hypothetical protein